MNDDEERGIFDALSALVLLLAALAGAYAPRYLAFSGSGAKDGSGTNGALFHLGNMLSGGVMLSAGFCHLLADSLSQLGTQGAFPTATFLAACGYILTLVADQIVQQYTEGGSEGAASPTKALGGSERRTPAAQLAAKLAALKPNNGALTGENGHARTSTDVRHAHKGSADDLESGEADGLLSRSPRGGSPRGGVPANNCASGSHAVQVSSLLLARKLPFATALLLAAALCVHSVLEGIALGAQRTMRESEDIMIAIAAHKGLAAYALGASVMQSGASPARFWSVIGTFAAATPMGILVGFAFSEFSSGSGGAYMSALASGVYLLAACQGLCQPDKP